ncbi:MAG TPA: ABC transporter permease [Candidatus Aquicultor sp.]|jgi:putative ABC transport system permease protein
MNLLESFLLALDAIIANKMRSALTTLGIIIGVLAVVLLVAIGQGAKNYVTQQIEGIGSNLIMIMPGSMDFSTGGNPGSTVNKLRLSHVRDIEREATNVNQVGALIEGAGTVKFGTKSGKSTIEGVMANYPDMLNYPVSEGTTFSEAQVSGGKKVAIIGSTLVDKLFNGSNPIGRRITVEGQKLIVIGTLESKGKSLGQDQDNVVFVPITLAQRMFGFEWVSSLVAEAKDENSVKPAQEEIKRILLKSMSKDDFSVMTQESILGTMQSILSILTLMLGGIAGISLLVGGIGIMNIMLVSVTERTREIGIRKAVGAKTHDILVQFIIEAATLSVIGGLIGIIIGFSGALLISIVFPATVPAWAVIVSFVFSAGIGIFFGAYPAYKASRLSPIEALRYE